MHKKAPLENKVIVIGLDGATFDIINPLIEQGRLKNIQGLIQSGVHGDLTSTIPPLSPIAWSSFSTGKNAGKHGIFGFTEPKDHGYEIRYINANSRKTHPFWSYTSEQNKKAIIINVPISYPPEKINGWMISGMDAPGLESEFTHPASLKKDLLDRFPKYTIDYSFIGSLNNDNGWQIWKNILEADKTRVEAAQYLMEKTDWDLAIVVLVGIDRVQHFYWHCMEEKHPRYHEEGAENFRNAISRMYEEMDALVGRLTHQLDESTTVVVMSDHGAGPFDDSVPYLNLNKWFVDQGYLELKSQDARSGDGNTNLRLDFMHQMRTILRKILPSNVRRKLKSRIPTLVEKFQSHLYFSNIQWSQTRVFASYDEFMARGIRINLSGRESEGIVQPGQEYEDLRERLIQEIGKLTHPETGQAIVKSVFRREDLYTGAFLEQAPDLIVLWNETAFFSQAVRTRDQTDAQYVRPQTNLLRSGEHRLQGILIANGPGIESHGEVEGAEISDLAPTIVHLLDLPVPSDMDGRVLQSLFQDGHRKPVKTIRLDEVPIPGFERDAYTVEEEQKIRKHLKDLGYLE